MDSAECVPQDEKLSNRYQLFTLKVKKIMKTKTSTHVHYNNFNTINKPGKQVLLLLVLRPSLAPPAPSPSSFALAPIFAPPAGKKLFAPYEGSQHLRKETQCCVKYRATRQKCEIQTSILSEYFSSGNTYRQGT